MSAYREIPEEELNSFHQEVYKAADRITQYFVLGYFAVGLGLAIFNNTWILAILMGGTLLGIYYVLRHYLPLTVTFHTAVAFIFWLFPLQFTIQMHGDLAMSFFYFVSLTVLLFYEDRNILYPVIGSAMLTYLVLFAGTSNGQFANLPMENLPSDTGHIILQLSIMLLYAGLTVLWANIQRKQTRESGINYIQMDEQLKMMEVNIAFADHISKGDLEANYPVEKSDRLGDSLLNMRSSLKEASIREQKEKFVNVGMASVGEILRNYVDSLDVLSDKVIEKLVSYLKANQGGIFILEEGNGGSYLELQACRAYDRKKFMERKIQVGEGLLGQTVLEKEITLMSEIPEGYLSITSGLGIASPQNLIIVPLKSNDEVVGVIELASFKEFDDTDIEFLEKVSESIASTVISAKTNQKTKELLESSRQMTEEMQAQEEEMRQNMEEMQATQEEMARTQKELAAKEANLQALINNTDDSIITIDKNYKILIMNNVVKARYRGTQFENMKEGDNALDMLGDVRDEWQGYYDQALRGERLNFILKSSVHGEDTWREYFLNPILDEHKDIIGISVFSRDITEKKKAQQQLAHEKAMFQALMDNVQDAIYYKDRESRFMKISKFMIKNFGVTSEEEILGKTDFDFFDEEHARPAFDTEQRIIESGEPLMGEVEKETHKDGHVTWAETSKMPLFDENGEIIGTFGLSKDITRSKDAEMKVLERNSLLNSVIENTPDAVFTIDREYQMVLGNSKVSELFKKAGLDISIGDKVPCDGKWKEYYDRALKGETFSVEDNELSAVKNVREHYLHMIGPVRNKENEIIGVSVVSRDLLVTETATEQIANGRKKK